MVGSLCVGVVFGLSASLEVGSLWSIGSGAANFWSGRRLKAVDFWRRQRRAWMLLISTASRDPSEALWSGIGLCTGGNSVVWACTYGYGFGSWACTLSFNLLISGL